MSNPYNVNEKLYEGDLHFTNNTADFVSNVNVLAKYVHLLKEQAPVLGNEGVRELLTASKDFLKEVIEDVHKGVTPEGYRKIDINLEDNLKDSKQLVQYNKAVITLDNDSKHTIIFKENVYSTKDVCFQLGLGITDLKAKGIVKDTLVETIPYRNIFNSLLRIKDDKSSFDNFSNIRSIALHATEDTLHIAKSDGVFEYDWFKTTSSILSSQKNLEHLKFLNEIMQDLYKSFNVKLDGFNKDYADFVVRYDEIVNKMTQMIDDKIIAQGGVEIAKEWGDSPDKVLSQEFLSEENLNIIDTISIVKNDLSAEIDELSKNVKPSYVKSMTYNGARLSIVFNINKKKVRLMGDEVSPKIFKRQTARYFANLGNSVVVNACAFKNADGSSGWQNDEVIPDGILIKDGVALYGWDNRLSTLRNQAMCIDKDGDILRYYDTTSVEEMVADGVVQGISWGAFLIYDSVIPDDFTGSVFDHDDVSARTVIGQNQEDNYVFIAIEGETDLSGLSPKDCAQLCLQLKLKKAYIVDGDGSTQMYFGNTYSTPSSDTTTRKVGMVFCADTAIGNEYDSGDIAVATNGGFGSVSTNKPTMYVRQTGKDISVTFNINGFINGLVNSEKLPKRFRTNNSTSACAVYTGGGLSIGALTSGTVDGLGNFSSYTLTSDTPPQYMTTTINYIEEFE